MDKLDQVLALDGLTVATSVEDDERTVELGPVEWAHAWETRLSPAVQGAGSGTWSGSRGRLLRVRWLRAARQ
ncbi:hypothetical protein ABZ917_21900 [Nonomuraea wenchangensis]